VKKIVHTWKQAQVVVERWRKNLTNVQVELKQPRVIDVSPIDFVSGEPIDRKGTPTKRQLMTQSKMALLLSPGSSVVGATNRLGC